MYSVANHKLSQSGMPTLSYVGVLLAKKSYLNGLQFDLIRTYLKESKLYTMIIHSLCL